MTAHHNILRAASVRAQAAAASATKHSAVNRVADTIPDHEVDTALAALPDAAEKGARLDPGLHNGYFLLAAWQPGDARATALYEAVARKLEALGIRSRFETVRKFFADLPYELYVSFDSLHEVAALESHRREVWFAEVREAWIARAGTGAEIKTVVSGVADQEAIVLTAPEGNQAMPDPLDRRPAHLRILEHKAPYDADKPVSAVIEEAVAALHLPVWTFEAVAEAWKAKSRGGDVVRSRGLWKGTAVRQVATMIFRGPRGVGHGAEVTVAVDDVHALSAGEIAELAYRDFTAAVFEAEAKAGEPHAAAVPVPPPVAAPTPAAEAPARGARSGLGDGTRFTAKPVTLDVPFTDHERAAAEAKTAFPKPIAIPGGVVRAVKDPEAGVAFRIETVVDGAVMISANAADAAEGADTMALLVEDAWKEAASKQGGEESASPAEPVTAPAAEGKAAKTTGPKAGAAKATAAR